MDVKSYCSSVRHEMTGWKAKLYDALRQAESLPGEDRQRLAPVIGRLNAAVDDLERRIARLDAECPAEFAAERGAIDGGLERLEQDWKQVYGVLGEKEYGLGGA